MSVAVLAHKLYTTQLERNFLTNHTMIFTVKTAELLTESFVANFNKKCIILMYSAAHS